MKWFGRIGLIAAVAVSAWWFARPGVPLPASDRPKLAVLIVFDQLRGDYLAKWESHFGPGGFRRLMDEGAWYRDCHYPYASTVTAAGHASVTTGLPPSVHGVVGNEWYERESAALVNCVSSVRHDRVPPRTEPLTPAEQKKPRGVSPDRLVGDSIADHWKANGGRVVSLSFKDRGAVLPGGHRPDACYWLDTAKGEFVTSTYYRDQLHPWVAAFNRGGEADAWVGTIWERFRPDLDYERICGPDDADGETKVRTFPHALALGKKGEKPPYYGALYASPFGNDLLAALAKEAVKAEALGSRDAPDLLCVSFSCNDAVGHAWGPDSQEVFDVTLRSDALMRDLLDFLDREVGAGNYVVALTSDHGVCPLPERSVREGREAARVPSGPLFRAAEAHLTAKFGAGNGKWVESVSEPWVYLSEATITARNADVSAVHRELADWLRTQPGMAAAYTRAELGNSEPTADALLTAARLNFVPDRCGDVFGVLKPYYLLGGAFDTGTTHGTPHAYDTHVPLIVFGPGVITGRRDGRVSPLATAAILGRAFGIDSPEGATPVPDGLFRR